MKVDATYSYLRSYFSSIVEGQPNLVISDPHFFESFSDKRFLEEFKGWIQHWKIQNIQVFTTEAQSDEMKEIVERFPCEVSLEVKQALPPSSIWLSYSQKGFEMKPLLRDYINGEEAVATFLESNEFVQKLLSLSEMQSGGNEVF